MSTSLEQASDNLSSKPSVVVTGVNLYPIQTLRRSGDASQHVLIRLETDSGIVGAGEYADITDLPLTMPDLDDLQKSLSNVLCAQNALELARLDHLLSELFTDRGDVGVYTESLRAGIEMTLHDIAGKALGIPELCWTRMQMRRNVPRKNLNPKEEVAWRSVRMLLYRDR